MSEPSPTDRAPRPLAGVRVLDLSRVLAGPWCGQLLADYGADVIKVERPGAGDDTRAWGPPWWQAPDGARTASYYLAANRGKRSVAADLASADGQALVRALAAEADVLIENYKVGQLAKYGLDHATLADLNPRLIYCSITGYGQDGPYAQRAGYDFAIQAQGGLMSITGEPGREPQKVGVAVADLMTGLYATTAILAALHEAKATGRGRHIDAALLDVQVAMLANQASGYLCSGRVPQRQGNAHPSIVPYQVFESADGHVVLAVGNDGQFERFCAVAGCAELAADSRYATNTERVRHRDELVPRLQQVMRQRTTAAWVEALEAAAVPCAPILDIGQVFADPHVVARGIARAADGAVPPAVLSPMRFDGRRAAAERPAPGLDADGDAIRAALARDGRWPGTDD
ncbi:CaiB/BaiF CoA transferase family protein [Azohydromonas sediminis]|uniref:CaiB/BaiF CoA transferase family protein n=1 Tax=Azohydromonas sediminis TaxID=2259674 RepID=UPI000E65508B